jgi:hypothetical protein
LIEMKWELAILISGLCGGMAFAQEKPAADPTTASGGNKPSQSSQDKKSTKTLTLYDVPTPQASSIDSPDEAADYFRITQTKDAAERTKLLEDFLVMYPKSSRIVQVQLWAVYQYQELNQPDKMIQHGEAILPQSGANPGFLATMAMAYNSTNQPEKGILLAEQALATLEKAVKPAQAKPDLWNAEKKRLEALNHAAAGSGFLSRYELSRKKLPGKTVNGNPATAASPPAASQSAPDAGQKVLVNKMTPEEAELLTKGREHLQKSLELLPNYDFAYFQLGILCAYQNDGPAAVDAFAHAVATGGGFSNSAQKNLEYLYKLTHKNSTSGMDLLVEQAKEDIKARLAPPAPAEPENAVPAEKN